MTFPLIQQFVGLVKDSLTVLSPVCYAYAGINVRYVPVRGKLIIILRATSTKFRFTNVRYL